MRRHRPIALGLALALVAATTAAYAPVVDNGYVWDDDAYITENETLREPGGLARIWIDVGATPQYYPLVHTSFWIESRLWGLDPRGFHIVNVLLHVLTALLAWRVLAHLSVPGAWWAALFFAVHPVHVESVAWITERKNVLSGALYFGAALAILRASVARDTERPSHRLYATALILFAGALLSKTVTGSLPAALLLVVWWKRGRIEIRDVTPLLPFFAMAAGLGGLTIWMEKHRVGAVGAPWDLSAVERVLIAGRAVWFYLAKLGWPDSLAFFYPRWRIDTGLGWQYLPPLAAVALVGALYAARRTIGRGPLVAVLFFGGTLVPALGFFDVYPMRYSFVADHFQYLASLGPLALVAAGFASGAKRFGAAGRRAGIALGLCATTALGTLTWQRVPVFHDLETLWTTTIAVNPRAWLAQYNLGNLRRRQGDTAGAARHYRQALGEKSDFAPAHNNLATVLGLRGRVNDAIHHYERAIAIDPDHALARFNLARVLVELGRVDEAIGHYREAIRVEPEYTAARHHLSLLLENSENDQRTKNSTKSSLPPSNP